MENHRNGDFVTIRYNGAEIQVTRAVADYLEESRREQSRRDRSDRRHLSDKRCDEDFIEAFMAEKPLSLEEIIVRQEQLEDLAEALAVLSQIQRRRLIAYYYENMTYQNIAERERVAVSAVSKSIQSAVGTLRKILGP
jgi:RNA polymerase sigma-70 factor (ECF subfamily)